MKGIWWWGKSYPLSLFTFFVLNQWACFNKNFSLFYSSSHVQCRGGSNRDVHRGRRDAWTNQTSPYCWYLWSRDLPAIATKLHGADGRPVHIHSRRHLGSDPVGEHGNSGQKSLHSDPEIDGTGCGQYVDRNGARIQSEILILNLSSVIHRKKKISR